MPRFPKPLALGDLQRIEKAHAAVELAARNLCVALILRAQTGVNDVPEAQARLKLAREGWCDLMRELSDKVDPGTGSHFG